MVPLSQEMRPEKPFNRYTINQMVVSFGTGIIHNAYIEVHDNPGENGLPIRYS